MDPSHVRRQKGPFEEYFDSFEEEEVEKWRRAMERIGGIFGFAVDTM